jgi:predicted MFS family arabinose efflux permease
LLFGALAMQVAIVYLIPDWPSFVLDPLHMITFLLGVWFVISNRHVPGVVAIGVGGAMNLIAIAANGGVMPASPTALHAAGLESAPGQFASSDALPDPVLSFLGDVFAVPKSWPVHNVFSLGDIVIVLGAAYALHRICASRIGCARGDGDLARLRRNGPFMRIWLAKGISQVGDWMYSLVVVATVSVEGHGVKTLALLLAAQVGPAALTGVLGGPLIDRVPRKRLMIGSDLARFAAVASLLVVGHPSVGHFLAVAVVLGVGGALVGPSIGASVPKLVDRDLLVPANALLHGTFNFAVTLGPVVGGLLVARLGAQPAFLLNAASFILSASLVLGVPLGGRGSDVARERPIAAIATGIRYVASTPMVRAVMIICGLAMLAASLRSPLEPIFFLRTLGAGPEALGFAGGAWGAGMLLGSTSAGALSRRVPRERLLALSFGLVGLALTIASQAGSLAPVLLLFLLAGFANAVGYIAYESLLQERTPDRVRGRVLAATESVLDAALLVGSLGAGALGAALGARGIFLLSGVLFFVTSGIAWAMLLRRGVEPAAGLVFEPVDELPTLSVDQLERSVYADAD